MTVFSPENQLVDIADASVDLKARKLYLIGDIDEESAKKFIVGLVHLDLTEGEITVVLSSGGGYESSGYAIYDAITMTKNVVIIEGYGVVGSIAAAIFQAGDMRRMAANASFMIHSGSVSPGEDVKQNLIVEMAEQIRRENGRYHEILSNASSLSVEEIAALCEHDTWYDAEESLAAGFCDEILVPIKVKKKRKRRKRS